MKHELELGTLESGRNFTLPLDFVTRTLAIIGIRGWGKTVTATVIAEEMCECGIPWIAFDPTSVWWGLRCNPDGTPGGYPVLVVGGPHGDLPLEKDEGPRIAEAVLQENLCCVIDLKLESKNTWRKFVADFCDRLMELTPAVPHHIFLEEAPEFVPQRPMGEQKRSLAAVDRLSRLGRNNGYGATLISQRYATVQKDVLTMCENLIAGLTIGKTDRDAMKGWIEEVVQVTESGKKADEFMGSLTRLENGVGWFWSPQWLDVFAKVRIRPRKTYHPGATRTFGQAPKQVALCDVREFVERFQRTLRTAKPKPPAPPRRNAHAGEASEAPALVPPPSQAEVAGLRQENQELRAGVARLGQQLGAARAAVEALRRVLEPEYRAMQKLFSDLDAAGANTGGIDAAVFEPWKEKVGTGPARMLEALIQRNGELTRHQLSTLSGYSVGSSTFREYLGRLSRNGLIVREGERIRLRVP